MLYPGSVVPLAMFQLKMCHFDYNFFVQSVVIKTFLQCGGKRPPKAMICVGRLPPGKCPLYLLMMSCLGNASLSHSSIAEDFQKQLLFVFKKSYNQIISTGKLRDTALHFSSLKNWFKEKLKQNAIVIKSSGQQTLLNALDVKKSTQSSPLKRHKRDLN